MGFRRINITAHRKALFSIVRSRSKESVKWNTKGRRRLDYPWRRLWKAYKRFDRLWVAQKKVRLVVYILSIAYSHNIRLLATKRNRQRTPCRVCWRLLFNCPSFSVQTIIFFSVHFMCVERELCVFTYCLNLRVRNRADNISKKKKNTVDNN